MNIPKATFTAEQLLDKVKELAAANPDKVYKGFHKSSAQPNACLYCSSKDEPDKGCIFGQGMLALQPDLEEYLKEVDSLVVNWENNKEGFSIGRILRDLEVEGREELGATLDRIQRFQDHGDPWGVLFV